MKDRIVIPEYKCLTCHYKMDSTSGAFEDILPKKGDITVCLKCGTAGQFDELRNIVPLTTQELEKIKRTDPRAYGQLRKVQVTIDSKNKKN
jgi:hypothetical protein